MVPGQHHVRMNMYIAQARDGKFEVVERWGSSSRPNPSCGCSRHTGGGRARRGACGDRAGRGPGTAGPNRRGTLDAHRGEIAQLVEHTTENRGVPGSSPGLATAKPEIRRRSWGLGSNSAAGHTRDFLRARHEAAVFRGAATGSVRDREAPSLRPHEPDHLPRRRPRAGRAARRPRRPARDRPPAGPARRARAAARPRRRRRVGRARGHAAPHRRRVRRAAHAAAVPGDDVPERRAATTS